MVVSRNGNCRVFNHAQWDVRKGNKSMTKPLFVLISDGGDGSYSANYTFNKAFIDQLKARDNAGKSEHGELGVDGDGFHYDTLNVPDECTLDSLGQSDAADRGVESND